MKNINVSKLVTVETVRKIQLSERDIAEILKSWAAATHGIKNGTVTVDFDVSRDEYLNGATITERASEEITDEFEE